MKSVRSIAAIPVLLTAIAVEAQDLTALASRYDSVAFYPESSIKGLYNLRRGLLNGEAIEFNEAGVPTDIGVFKRGKRHRIWISSDGHTVKYKRGERQWGSYPGCGTGWRRARTSVQERDAELIRVL